jgi:hypothetical protein
MNLDDAVALAEAAPWCRAATPVSTWRWKFTALLVLAVAAGFGVGRLVWK